AGLGPQAYAVIEKPGLSTGRAHQRAAVGRRPARGDDGINRERFVPLQQDDDSMRAARQREMVVVAVEVVDSSHEHAVDVDGCSPWLDRQLQSAFGGLALGERWTGSRSNAIKLVAKVLESNAAIEHERPGPPVA